MGTSSPYNGPNRLLPPDFNDLEGINTESDDTVNNLESPEKVKESGQMQKDCSLRQ